MKKSIENFLRKFKPEKKNEGENSGDERYTAQGQVQ